MTYHDDTSHAYQDATAAHSTAAATYHAAASAHMACRIDNAAFLAAQAEYGKACDAFDVAFAAEQAR